MRKIFLVNVLFVTNIIVLSSNSIADDGASIIPVREINEVLLKGLDNIAEGRSVSDIVVRHLNVGEENFGVSVVQRDQVEVRDEILGTKY